jgi:hypothetical protein
MERLRDRICQHLLPTWRLDCTPDRHHAHRRRYTTGYRNKQRVVKSCWICSGLLALATPTLNIVLALGLATTFLSFMLLDETG